MEVIAALCVDTAKTMTYVTMYQASVLEDVRGNGWEIGVMVGLTVGMWIKTPDKKKTLKYGIYKLSQLGYVTAVQLYINIG